MPRASARSCCFDAQAVGGEPEEGRALAKLAVVFDDAACRVNDFSDRSGKCPCRRDPDAAHHLGARVVRPDVGHRGTAGALGGVRLYKYAAWVLDRIGKFTL
jgi:hypothetical protein